MCTTSKWIYERNLNAGELPGLGEKYLSQMKCEYNTLEVKHVLFFHEFQHVFLA